MKIIVLLSFIVIFFSCGSGEDFQEIEENYHWKLLAFSDDSTVIKKGALVQFDWKIVENTDTLFQERLFIKVDSIFTTPGITRSLNKLKQGEAAAFKFLPTQIEKEFADRIKLKGLVLDPEKQQIHYIKIDKIYSLSQFEKDKKAFLRWINEQGVLNDNALEKRIIKNYIETQFLGTKNQFTETESGLFIKLLPSNSAIKTSFGKKIKLSYQGGVLNNKQTVFKNTQDFRIGEEMQVIKAIEEALLMMEMGDSAVLIAPSHLAFGEKGSSTGLIPPASTVYYELKLDSVEN